MSKNKNRNRRLQAVKDNVGRNEDWMRARLEHSNRNLTVPSGNRYKRPKAGARGRDW